MIKNFINSLTLVLGEDFLIFMKRKGGICLENASETLDSQYELRTDEKASVSRLYV